MMAADLALGRASLILLVHIGYMYTTTPIALPPRDQAVLGVLCVIVLCAVLVLVLAAVFASAAR